MTTPLLWALPATALLLGVHLLAGRFHYLVGAKRSVVHSCLAGITTAYLFLKLLPELGAPGPLLGAVPAESSRRLLFAVALGGFLAFYAAEVWAHQGRQRGREGRVYRLLLVTFALFNAALAFLLPQQIAVHGPWVATTFVLAIGVHLLVLDHAVAEAHHGQYGLQARLVHGGGLLAGLLLAALLGSAVWEIVAQPLIAFVGGAIALQVFREEIPAYKCGRPLPFAAGAMMFAALLWLAETVPGVATDN